MAKGKNTKNVNVDESAAATAPAVVADPAPAVAEATTATATTTKKGGKKGKATEPAVDAASAASATSAAVSGAESGAGAKTGKKGGKKAAAAASASEPVATPTEVAAGAGAAGAAKEKFVPNIENFDALVARLDAMVTAENERHKNAVAEYKQIARELGHFRKLLDNQAKAAEKIAEKKAKKQAAIASGEKKAGPNGLTKPMNVKPELLKFLGKDSGTMLSVREICDGVHNYAKSNGLKVGKVINLDAPLKKLLPTAGDTMEYAEIVKKCKDAGLYTPVSGGGASAGAAN